MSTGNIPPAGNNGDTIFPALFDKIRDALLLNIVPRNGTGVATNKAGSLGQSGLRFLDAFLSKITLGDSEGLVIEEDAGEFVFKIGGNERARITNDHLFPPGMIAPKASTSVPKGWLYCDGQAVSRTTYQRLFDEIGTAYGNGDGTTTFNVPDFRGRHLRGTDDAQGRDLGAGARTESAPGSATGDNVGSYQADAVGPFTYESAVNPTATDVEFTQNSSSGKKMTNGVPTRNGGGAETNVKNVYVKFFIKT